MQEDALKLRLASDSVLQVLSDVAEEYRQMWASLSPPCDCAFDGTPTDIDALDFVDYEAGYHPRDLLGASMIWGNVLVSTGVLNWLASDAEHLFVGNVDYPRFLIWPYARVLGIDMTPVIPGATVEI